MKISYGSIEDMDFILEKDHHVNKELVEFKLNLGEYILAKDGNGNSIGWLRYNYFWDNTPFLNLIYVDERFRGRNLGKNLLDFWEAEMKKKAYSRVMTSSLSDEKAQFFYRKLNYRDCGSLFLDGQALEIMFVKEI